MTENFDGEREAQALLESERVQNGGAPAEGAAVRKAPRLESATEGTGDISAELAAKVAAALPESLAELGAMLGLHYTPEFDMWLDGNGDRWVPEADGGGFERAELATVPDREQVPWRIDLYVNGRSLGRPVAIDCPFLPRRGAGMIAGGQVLQINSEQWDFDQRILRLQTIRIGKVKRVPETEPAPAPEVENNGLCNASRGDSTCAKVAGHVGDHIDGSGRRWEPSPIHNAKDFEQPAVAEPGETMPAPEGVSRGPIGRLVSDLVDLAEALSAPEQAPTVDQGSSKA